MNDIILTSVNIVFLTGYIHQIYKNFRIKDTKVHSYYMYTLTCMCLLLLGSEYVQDGLLLSSITITIAFSLKYITLLQMIYYNHKNRKELLYWM